MRYYLLVMAFLLTVITGCSIAPKPVPPSFVPTPFIAEQSGRSIGADTGTLPSIEDRKIARTGNLSLVV